MNPFPDFGPHAGHGRWLPGTVFLLVTYKCHSCGKRIVDEPFARPPSSGGMGPQSTFWPVCYDCHRMGRGPTYEQVCERARAIYEDKRFKGAVVATPNGPQSVSTHAGERRRWQAIYDYLGTNEEEIGKEDYEAIVSGDGDSHVDGDDFFFKYKEYSERMAAARHLYIANKEEMQKHIEEREKREKQDE